MTRLSLTLNGRLYSVTCADGDEPRLAELAAYVDDRARSVEAGSPGSTDAQIMALTALVLADEVFDLKGHRAPLATKPAGAPPPSLPPAEDKAVIAAVDHLAKRIEDIASRLERP